MKDWFDSLDAGDQERLIRGGVAAGVILTLVWIFFGGRSSISDGRNFAVAMEELSMAKTDVHEYYQATGRMPASNREVKLEEPESYRDGKLLYLTVVQGGAIETGFTELFGVENAVIRHVPMRDPVSSNIRTWECISPNIADIASFAVQCRYEPDN